jgi:hypothetical protein
MSKNCGYIALMMGPALLFGYLGKQVEMGLIIVASFTTFVLLNFEKFKRFKAGTLEAEMKESVEKAEKVVKEATATITALRNVATPLIISAAFSVSTHNRIFSAMDPAKQIQLIDSLKTIANELEIKDQKVEESLKTLGYYLMWDHFNNIKNAIRIDQNNQGCEDINSLYQSLKEWAQPEAPSKDVINQITEPYFLQIGMETKEALADYQYYCDHGKIRRLADFKRLHLAVTG